MIFFKDVTSSHIRANTLSASCAWAQSQGLAINGPAGRRGYVLLLAAALVAMPVRGLIVGPRPSPYALIPVQQMLDGVGASLLSRTLKGTGHITAGLRAPP